MFLEGHSAVYYAAENVVYLYGGYLIDQQRYSAELIRVHVGLMQPRHSSSSSSSAGKEMVSAPSASDSSQFIFRNPSAVSSENSVVQSSSSAVAQPQGHTATKLFEPPPGWSASRTAEGDGYETALGGQGGGSNGHSDPYLSASARRSAAVAQSASLSVRTERFVPTTGDHPGPRAYHGCCIVDHYLYLYGGSNDSDSHDADLLSASSSLSPEGEAAAASAASSSSSLLNDLHVLDLQTMQWERRVPSVRNYPDASRTHGELIPSGSGTLWYVGGFTDKSRSSGGGGVASAEEDALLQEILLDGTVRRKLIGHRGVAGRLATPLWGQSTAALSDGTFVVIGGMNSQTEELATLMGNRKRCEELAWEDGAWQSTIDHGASSSSSSSGPCRRMLHSLVSVHRVPNDPTSPVAGLLLFGGFTDSPDESDLVNEAEDLQAHQALSSLRCPVLSPEYLPPPRDPMTMRSATKVDTAAASSREEGATPCMLQDVWWYSTAVGMWEQWATKGPLPAARSGHAAVVAGPYMLLFGGTSSDWDPPPSSSSASSPSGKDRRGVGRAKSQWLTVDWVCHALELRTRQWSVCLLDQEFHREHATTSGTLSASAQSSPAGRARATTATPPSSSSWTSEAAARRESPLDAVLANVSAASAGGKRAAVAVAPKRSSLPQAGRSVAAPSSPSTSSSTSRPLSFFSTFDPSYGTDRVPPSSRPTIGNSFSPVLQQQQYGSLRPDDDASFASPAGEGGVIARLRDPRLLVSLQDSPPNHNFNRHDYSSRRQQQYVGTTASSPSLFASPHSAQVAQTSNSTPNRGGNTTTFQFVSPSSPSSSAAYASPGGGILLKRPSAFRSSGGGGDEIDSAVYANVTSVPSTTTAAGGGSRRRGGSPSPRMVRFLLGSAELGSRSSAEREIQVVSPSLLDDDEVLLN